MFNVTFYEVSLTSGIKVNINKEFKGIPAEYFQPKHTG